MASTPSLTITKHVNKAGCRSDDLYDTTNCECESHSKNSDRTLKRCHVRPFSCNRLRQLRHETFTCTGIHRQRCVQSITPLLQSYDRKVGVRPSHHEEVMVMSQARLHELLVNVMLLSETPGGALQCSVASSIGWRIVTCTAHGSSSRKSGRTSSPAST